MLYYKLLRHNIEHESILPYEIPFCLKWSLTKLFKVEEQNRKREDALMTNTELDVRVKYATPNGSDRIVKGKK